MTFYELYLVKSRARSFDISNEPIHYHSLKILCQTHQLQLSNILLPPQVLLEPRSQSRQEIIRIHDDVHDGVEESQDCPLTTGCKLQVTPGVESHDHVVVDVEEGHLDQRILFQVITG